EILELLILLTSSHQCLGHTFAIGATSASLLAIQRLTCKQVYALKLGICKQLLVAAHSGSGLTWRAKLK
ncbi:MAG: hypothetical protein KA388_03190, partial [Rhodocyclaceae bacterium]|nr:hypothetical protein [Rhodocyclaceae bacterium]